MKPVLISALYHPYQVGGAEKVARIVAEGLLERGHEPVVITTQPDAGIRVDHVNGVKVHYIGLKNLYWPHARQPRSGAARVLWHAIDRYNPAMAAAVGRVLDQEKPDVVHTHALMGFSCAVWKQVKSRGLPLVHTLHDYALMCPKTAMFRDGCNCATQCGVCATYTAPSKRLSRQVDHVVGVSRYTLERHLQAGYFAPTVRQHVIYNAIAALPDESPRHPRAPGPLRLGYVGQLIPTKGIRELIEQMSAWSPDECQLLVAGKGAAAYEQQLRTKAPPNVRFLGFIDPDELYAAIDLLVVPSLWQEPLGMIVLEAYMHGIPAVVSHRGGLPEIVDEGRTGTTYEPSEAGSLREAIGQFVRDPLKLAQMRPAVLRKARHFVLERLQDEYLRVMADAQGVHAAGASSRLLGRPT